MTSETPKKRVASRAKSKVEAPEVATVEEVELEVQPTDLAGIEEPEVEVVLEVPAPVVVEVAPKPTAAEPEVSEPEPVAVTAEDDSDVVADSTTASPTQWTYLDGKDPVELTPAQWG